MATASFPYQVLTVTSPMCFGGEDKNQDRVRWCASTRTAGICDGVTSSPFAADAAEMVAAFTPALFQGSIEDRLHAISDLLVARRLEAQNTEFRPPANTSPAMSEMLREAARQRMTHAFQTTLVGAGFTPTEDAVMASVVRCGDSVFLAYAPDGTVLTTSPSGSNQSGDAPGTTDPPTPNGRHRFRFGPGDELLVRVRGSAAERHDLVDRARLTPAMAHKWLVCSALDACAPLRKPTPTHGSHGCVHWIGRDDLLLVPRYLAGGVDRGRYGEYRRLRFSRLIRPITANGPARDTLRFDGPGTATAVLPDHIYSGGWSHFEERFSLDTRFLLASDGLTGCFPDPAGLWRWLHIHEDHLGNPQQQAQLLHDLHAERHARCGDDDISFVWIRPHENSDPTDDRQEEHDAG